MNEELEYVVTTEPTEDELCYPGEGYEEIADEPTEEEEERIRREFEENM